MLCASLSREESNELYEEIMQTNDSEAIRRLCKEDLFFLLTVAFKRRDVDRDWIYDRCREVEKSPNGYLDLWSRDHYKSTVITYAKTIQDILNNPEITIGIFSHTRPIAKGFLDQIKRELEQNDFLKNLFPDILYKNPQSEAPKWSLDSGIIVKRKTNPKESTVEAWGLVDGQPTSKHFGLLVYDDIVTRESVTTSDQINKTTSALELSYNLGTNHGGVRRFIGTRYHSQDTYKVIMDRETVIPRIYPATNTGKFPEGEPVLLTKEQLTEKRKDMGPYTFACFPANSPVLMADWSDKPIDKIKVGEFVVGYSLEKGKKAKLIKTKVIAINSRKSIVIEAAFESGRVVRCTPDHKWYTGRRGVDAGGTDSHLTYVKLGFDKCSLKSLASVYDPRVVNGKFDEVAAAWLSGFFDGEGSTSGNSIHLHQTNGKNLVVCERLEENLKKLSFDYGFTQINRCDKWEPIRDYFIKGGREEQIRFLRQCKPARAHKIIDMLFQAGTRNFGKVNRDKLVSIKEVGEEEVFNIQTETGNYVCYGYATKNCQMLQNPTADNLMGFKEEWLKYYDKINTKGWNIYIIVDPASKKKKTSDYTVMEVIGLAPDNNYYLIDAVRDRMNLTERTKALFALVRKHNPLAVGYERYGMQSDIEHITYVMEQENYRFKIIELGGSMAKEDRIRRLVPIYEQGRFYSPKMLRFADYEGRSRDYIQDFKADEFLTFPVSVHDDMLDCRARILDPELDAKFPKGSAFTESSFANYGGTGTSWMGG